MFRNLIGIVLVAAAGLAGVPASAAQPPVDLRCAMRVNPLGIGDVTPRLSWQLAATPALRGETQSAYQVQVGSTSGAADLWDSGKVAGSQTVDVPYGGPPLTSGEKCFWQVRVYDGSNNVSAWSAPACWSMGLLSPTNWLAQWIGYDAAYNLTPGQVADNALFNISGLGWISASGQSQQNGVYSSALRKQVVLPAGFTNAVVVLYVDNFCNVYVNGQLMTNSAMSYGHPGGTAARWEATARINVTPWLHAGTNELALAATSSDTQEGASVIGRLVVQFAAGSVSDIPVDTSWKAASWPTGNWTATNYDDSAWGAPGSGGIPWGTPSLNDLPRVPAPYLRKNFTVSQAVTRATVFVTALGMYELHLNGQKVGNDVLTPGWTQFSKRVYYQTYDVTTNVQSGGNTISAILGDGWYASDLGLTGVRLYYGGMPRFLAQLVLQLADGSTQTVVSDGSWKASYGPIQWGDLMFGTEYDARLEMPGWDTASFDDSAWSPVATGLSGGGLGYGDMTTFVTGLVTSNQLNFVANNFTMGRDPAPGTAKTFQITYTLGGTNQTLSVAESGTVNIGGAGQSLTIIQALYGNAAQFPGAGYTNATAFVTSLVTSNQLNFVVNNTLMGGDPAPDIMKTFQITYTLGGTNQTQTYWEGATVQIGGGGLPLTIIQALYGNLAQFPGAVQVQAAVTEPSRCLETVAATNLTVPSPGCYTFDLGQNMAGWVQLNISGSVGDRITVRGGEMLNPNGTVYTANLRGANATDFYIFGTNGTVTFQPRFTLHGFRYVEVLGLTVPPTLSSVTGIVVHSDMTRSGAFACSSPLVNQLYSNIIWGHKGNYIETSTDCPQRDEREGYTGDTEFFIPTAVYNFDIQTFERRYIMTMDEDSLIAGGGFPAIAPNIGTSAGPPAWGDAGWICPYNVYRIYGDTNIINDHYVAMKNFGQYVSAYASGYLISSLPDDLGDWLNLGSGASFKVIDTAYYAGYAQAMSEMAAAIGNTADAATYATLHSNIVAASASLFNTDGTFTDGSGQTGYALAFTMNLVPAALRTQVAQQFANSIAQYGNHLATGFIGTPRLLPALHLAGRDDLAYTLLLQQSYPSWLYQVNLGATTMWERWDGWTPSAGFESVGMNSFNHYSFGAVGQYLYSGIGGISPASPGYATILIQPVPGLGLTWANTSYTSTRGLISTAWTNTGSAFNLAVVIPPNTTAQVYVPTTNASAITESGVPAASSPGVTYVGVSNSTAIYSVGSGNYLFSSPYRVSAVIVTTTNQTGSGTGSFIPSWGAVTNGSLIAGQLPSSATGDFDLEPYFGTRSVNSLTAGGNLAISEGGSPTTTSANYVTCGNGGSPAAGSSVIYTLTGSTNGYDLTNIVVYGGWGDSGRDQQAYTVYYSTVAAPANYIPLATVNFNPTIASGVQDATRVSITYSGGVLAGNVAAVKFDFTSPSSENGYCGYSQITMFGTPSTNAISIPIITTTNQTGSGSGPFYPGWTVVTNGSLIAGHYPDAASGNFSEEVSGRNVSSLTAGGSLGIALIQGTLAGTASTNYVTCGNGNGAGSSVTYDLTGSAAGYDLTNLTVYGGWVNNGRDQQAYTVYYSTAAAPTTFLQLAQVNFNPAVAANLVDATRVTLTSSVGVLASNVAAVMFDFTNPSSENGYCGYAAITVFGTASIPPALPADLSATAQATEAGFMMNIGSLVVGRNYTLQSTTNLSAAIWSTETNFVATQTTTAWTNSSANYPQKFYRLMGF